jgi:hypothetical protein
MCCSRLLRVRVQYNWQHWLLTIIIIATTVTLVFLCIDNRIIDHPPK